MKANQLLIVGAKKLAIGIIAGFFGFAVTKATQNISPVLAFDVDESIVGKSYIDENNVIITMPVTEDYVAKEQTLTKLTENYTRDVLKESGMNNLDDVINVSIFHVIACKTQKVVNLELFRPPRTPLARSDIINTS